jgi:branched-chain amino acid transport system permease protein
VYGVLRLINFAHSEVFMIGTVAALFTLTTIGVSAPIGGIALIGMLLLLSAVAVVVSSGTAMALEYVAYRPLRKKGASRLAALISAIGASLFLQQLFALLVIPQLFNLPQEGGRLPVQSPAWVQRSDVISIGDFVVRNDKLLVVIGAVLMMIALDQFVDRTKLGRGIKAFTAAVLGGIGNLRGALVGGLVLGLIEMYGSALLGSEWQHVVAFTVLVLVLMFRPTGILGESLQQARA